MHITAAESQVMEALWRGGPMTVGEIVAEVSARQAWGEATVKTLINRLLRKKAIASGRQDGRHQYRALLARADYVHDESQSLLDRLFDGQFAPLVSHFAERHALKPEDIARLKQLIEELGDDG